MLTLKCDIGAFNQGCPLHGTMAVSYTHLDVYKRQVKYKLY